MQRAGPAYRPKAEGSGGEFVIFPTIHRFAGSAARAPQLFLIVSRFRLRPSAAWHVDQLSVM